MTERQLFPKKEILSNQGRLGPEDYSNDSVYHGAAYGLISTLALRANFAQAIHYNGVLASVPAIHFRLHPPPALSTMPVWQNFPLYRLLGFPKMNDRCPTCGLHFNREPGYFLGAMYISYGLAVALLFPLGAILWVLTGWRLDKVAIWAVLFFLLFAPMLTFLSRVLWIYLDQTIDPETR